MSFGFSNNIGQSSRRVMHNQGRGHNDQPEPSQSCTSPPPPPPHAPFCRDIPLYYESFHVVYVIQCVFGKRTESLMFYGFVKVNDRFAYDKLELLKKYM